MFRPSIAGVRETPAESRSPLGQMIGGAGEMMTRREGGPATEIPVKIGRNTKWISGVNEHTTCGVRLSHRLSLTIRRGVSVSYVMSFDHYNKPASDADINI